MIRSARIPMFLLAGMLLAATEAAALYTPNPAARWPADRFFLAGDFQFHEKDLDRGGELDDVAGFYARPTFSIARNVVVYGRVGAQEADGLDFGLAAGAGIQASYVFPNAPQWAIGGAFDFLFWDAETEGGRDLDYTEFQLTPAVAYTIPSLPELTPYGGLYFDFLGGDLDQEDTVGPLVGLAFAPNPRWRIDAQLRGVAETGFGLSIGYLF